MSQNSQIHNLLTKWVSNVIDRANLEKRLLAGEKLRVKFGIDPTAAKIHIGHMVPFLKLKEFQALGHEIVLLFGDATAQVGDTSDKDAERPMLTREETRRNCEVFLQKFSKVIDISKINVYYNSEGLDAVNFAWVGELAKNFSVAEMLDRDNFSKRYKEGKRISLQEFLYPIMQGYDSVAIAKKYGSCDLELGGNDQYFNLLAGRTMMNAFGLPKQDIMTFDLLVGTDGKKMSKTSPNCILIDDTPFDMYQKLINVDDALIVHYFTFATDMTIEQVDVIAKRLESGEHPNILKKELADYVVTMYHGKPYDPSDVNNIEVENLGYYKYVNILLRENIINQEMVNRANEAVDTNDLISIVTYINWINDKDEINSIKNQLSITKGGISYQEALRVIMSSIWELPSNLKQDKYDGWIKRAKEIGVKLRSNLEGIILLKELFELVTSFIQFSTEEDQANIDETIRISDLLKLIWFCATSWDVRNALAGNSIRVNGEVVTDSKFLVTISSEGTLVEMGKKKAKRVFI